MVFYPFIITFKCFSENQLFERYTGTNKGLGITFETLFYPAVQVKLLYSFHQMYWYKVHTVQLGFNFIPNIYVIYYYVYLYNYTCFTFEIQFTYVSYISLSCDWVLRGGDVYWRR